MDDKKRYWNNFIWRGRCSSLINRQYPAPVVLNGQCNFAYKLAPHLKKRISYVELIHVSEKKFAAITHPYIPFLPLRITNGQRIVRDFQGYYQRLGVPAIFYPCWQVIPCGVAPATAPERNLQLPLKICYVGRGGVQKRLWLIFEIIRQCNKLHLPVEWHFAGPFEQEIPVELYPQLHYHGILKDQADVYSLFQQMDCLLLTSVYEGFPLVVMEAMMNGVVPICTSVGSIPEHLVHDKNSFLLQKPEKEHAVVEEAVSIIESIVASPHRLATFSSEAHTYATKHFAEDRFLSAWRTRLFPSRETVPI